jgi:hypothetical protein
MDFTQRVQRLATDFERQLADLARAMAEQVVAAAVAAAHEAARRTLNARGPRATPALSTMRGRGELSPTASSTAPAPSARPSPRSVRPASPSPAPAASQLRPSAPAPRPPETPVAPPSPRPRARSEKRKPGGLSDLRERIVQCVQRQPGLSVEELNRALGTTTEEVQQPLRMLLTRGVLRVEGELTTARYFPQTRGWAASTPPRR